MKPEEAEAVARVIMDVLETPIGRSPCVSIHHRRHAMRLLSTAVQQIEQLTIASSTLGKPDDDEPFTLADWEALRYPKNEHSEIDTMNGDTIFFRHTGAFAIASNEGGCELTIKPISKREARELLQILCGEEPKE